jgi:endoglucanase
VAPIQPQASDAHTAHRVRVRRPPRAPATTASRTRTRTLQRTFTRPFARTCAHTCAHPRTRARTRTRTALAALIALAALLTGCTSGGDPRPWPAARGPYWVNPDTPAARQAAAWRKAGRVRDADYLERIAREPVAEWIGPDNPYGQTYGITEGATAAHRTALLVLYDIPHRDCGQYSRGGAADGDTYRRWLEGVAQGIADRRATVILEPDAVIHAVDGCTPQAYLEERYALLSYAVNRLKALPHTAVYLDAGNAGWVHDPGELAGPLIRAGLRQADGFALNTSNFYSTSANAAYGHRLSKALGQPPTHFVVDTSRNGLGPLPGGGQSWCNPPGRALGTPPTTHTGDPLIDAYLWIKHPGDSDGPCRAGPAAGTWWPSYALGLARRARYHG